MNTKEPDWSWDFEHEKKLCIIANLNLEITKEIVAKKLINLNIHKSPGPDKLHPRVFKELAQELAEPLFLILKSSLKLGKIPSAWKLASITPIYKNKGDKQISHGLYDNEIINNFLRFRPNDRQYLFRGQGFNLPKEHFKKDVRKFSFRCRITNQWHNLPEKIVDATNINVFKNRLDDYWEKEEMMYDPEVDIYTRTSYRRAGIAN